MRITTDPRDNATILNLAGEFGTLDCPPFVQEIQSLVAAGVRNVILNLRLTKYINSTALGALIRASKTVDQAGGKLVVSRPSVFCRNAITGVGLEAVVPIYDNDEIALERLEEAAPEPPGDDAKPIEEENNTLLFSPTDQARAKEYVASVGRSTSSKRNWHGVGSMAELDTKQLRFFWDGGNTGLNAETMAKLLSPGTELKVKFRLPMLQRGYREALVTVGETEAAADGVRVVATYKALDQDTANAVKQYTQDIAFLRQELDQATGRATAGDA